MNEKRQAWALRFAPLFAVALWALCTASIWVVPAQALRGYGTVWLGVGMFGALYFTAGYTRFAKVIKTDQYGDKHVDPEGLGLLSMSLGLLVLTSYLFIFRVINERPPVITPDQIFQFKFAAAAFIFVTFVNCGWAVLWTIRQVNTRRAAKRG